MITSAELFAQAHALMGQANEALKQEKAAVIADVKSTISKYNLTAGDLGLATHSSRKQRRKDTIAYRGPGGEEWSGLGRQPTWLKEALAAGQSKEEFRV